VAEGDVTETLMEIEPGRGACEYSETVGRGVPQGRSVPHFDGTYHRETGKIGMRAVENFFMHDTAVEMNQGLAVFALPPCDTLSAFLIVLADDVIADRIKVILISSDCLVSFQSRNAPYFLAAPTLRGSRQGSSGCG
jgi:hypothetical protein